MNSLSPCVGGGRGGRGKSHKTHNIQLEIKLPWYKGITWRVSLRERPCFFWSIVQWLSERKSGLHLVRGRGHALR